MQIYVLYIHELVNVHLKCITYTHYTFKTRFVYVTRCNSTSTSNSTVVDWTSYIFFSSPERLRGLPSLQYGYRLSFPSSTEFFLTCSKAEAWFVVNLTPFTQPVAGHIKCFVFQSVILTTDLQRAQNVRQESNTSGRPVALYTYTVY
jgi:hypothetical protein